MGEAAIAKALPVASSDPTMQGLGEGESLLLGIVARSAVAPGVRETEGTP